MSRKFFKEQIKKGNLRKTSDLVVGDRVLIMGEKEPVKISQIDFQRGNFNDQYGCSIGFEKIRVMI